MSLRLIIEDDEGATTIVPLGKDSITIGRQAFDEVFHSEGAEVLITPMQAPQANAYAERWIRTVRTECLDWLLIWNRRHVENVGDPACGVQRQRAALTRRYGGVAASVPWWCEPWRFSSCGGCSPWSAPAARPGCFAALTAAR